MEVLKSMSGLLTILITSIVLILLGMVYFMLTIWMIKIGAEWAGFRNVEGGMVVLGACIITAATMIGSASKK